MPSMGEIVAHLGLNDSKFKAGVNNVGQWSKAKFAAIGGVAAGVFAASFGVSKIKEMITAAKDVKTFGQQAGISAEEFQKLVDMGKTSAAVVEGDTFSNVQTGYYWTSTLYEKYRNYAASVRLVGAYIHPSEMASPHFVWPVRGGK